MPGSDERFETAEAIHMAAVAHLHKELEQKGEIRLTQADLSYDPSDAIKLEYDPTTGDIIFRHVKSKNDA